MAFHWADDVSGELLKRGGKQVLETGTSISGVPHLGNASDVIRADAVRKALDQKGADVELIWVADDSDPFRKVPKGFESLKDFLGFPVKDIPDPFGCHKNFVEHFVTGFVEELSDFGVVPTVYSGTELYRSGALNEEIKIAFEKSKEIVRILNKFRTTPIPDNHIPWTPICPRCGKISTAKAIEARGTVVKYVCQNAELSGGKAEGCGYIGEADALDGMGKMPWRVEWAARWHHFKVTCEPMGKEHAAAGGSFWTAKEICKDVFGWEPPVPVMYEFFTLNGAKISSSKGNVITLREWFQICEAEVLRFFMYKRLNKQRDINLFHIPLLVDEYDEAEEIWFSSRNEEPDEDVDEIKKIELVEQTKLIKENTSKSEEELFKRLYGNLWEDNIKTKRSYELAQIGEPARLGVPFTLCTTMAQIVPDLDAGRVKDKVLALGYKDFDAGRLQRRLRLAKNWVEKHGTEQLRFVLLDQIASKQNYDKLDDKQKEALSRLAGELNNNHTAEQFHKRTYETARGLELKPDLLFTAIYSVLIGKEKGPKAASFILSMDRDYVVSRFNP